ncbi:hypothetical protein DKX38_011906 [Salix brachista]|uniref:Bifunctional inhibitor/plant lipid transfer protein/seed storage helical domain-containing protein n=1 Tax=Salix brachista TaxID=2182728 RepID=A0A5N5M0A7_9ROSI|nr:hypothetical protein DKX38_011906 [Salix brachista]
MFSSCSTKKFEQENPTIHYDIGYERQHLTWFSRTCKTLFTHIQNNQKCFAALFHFWQVIPLLSGSSTPWKLWDFSKECKDVEPNFKPCSGFIQGLLEETSRECYTINYTTQDTVLLKAELMARIVGFLILAISAQAMAKFDVDPDQCQVIFDNFPYCMDFLIGSNDWPSRQCCQRVYDFNALAKQGMGPRAICECIEIITVTIPMKLRVDRISDLPVRCSTHLSFPISEYMDCNR